MMISFELWSSYFLFGIDKKKVENYRRFFLDLRTLNIEYTDYILKDYFEVLLSDLLTFSFRPLKERISNIPKRITSEYLKEIEPVDFPYTVKIDSIFNLFSPFLLVTARTFRNIHVRLNIFYVETLDFWNLIKDNIKVFSAFTEIDVNSENSITLPECRSLDILNFDIFDTYGDNIKAPKVTSLKLHYNEDQDEIPFFPQLKKLYISDNDTDRSTVVTENVFQHTGIESLTIRGISLEQQLDLSGMTSLKKLKIEFKNVLNNGQFFPVNFPSSLRKLTIICRKLALRESIGIPAIPHLKIRNNDYNWFIQATPQFPNIQTLEFSNGYEKVPVYLDRKINPRIIFPANYVDRYIYVPGENTAYVKKEEDNDIVTIKDYEAQVFESKYLPQLSDVTLQTGECRYPIAPNVTIMILGVEEEIIKNPSPVEFRYPNVVRIKVNEPYVNSEVSFYEIIDLVKMCPKLEEIIIYSHFYKEKKQVVEYILKLLNVRASIFANYIEEAYI